MKKVFLCTESIVGSRPALCRWEYIDDRGWIDGETPVEDFGMFFWTDKEISPESAKRIFTALICHEDGEEPEIKAEITEDDKIRPVFMPPLLTVEENEVFRKLID